MVHLDVVVDVPDEPEGHDGADGEVPGAREADLGADVPDGVARPRPSPTMAMPPMVGVPALATWVAGPSSLMCWPISRLPEVADEKGGGEDGDPQRDAPRDEQSEHVASGFRMRAAGAEPTAAGAAVTPTGGAVGAPAPRCSGPTRSAPTGPGAPRPRRRRADARPRSPDRSRGPCPAMTTTSPGAAASRARRIATPRSGSTTTRGLSRPPGIPPSTSSMMARRILVAWVVRRHEGEVAQARRHRAHQRALGPVPVPAAPEDAQHPTARRERSEPRPAPPRARRACARSRRAR